jgi:hypothetical protein
MRADWPIFVWFIGRMLEAFCRAQCTQTISEETRNAGNTFQ